MCNHGHTGIHTGRLTDSQTTRMTTIHEYRQTKIGTDWCTYGMYLALRNAHILPYDIVGVGCVVDFHRVV